MPGAESVVCPPLLFHPSDTTLMGLSLSTSCSVTEFTQPEGTAMQPLPPSAVVLNFMISHLAAKFHLARHLACQCCFISCCDLVPPRLSCRCDPSLGLFLPLHSDRHHNHTRFPHCVMCSDVGAFLWQCQPFSPRFVQKEGHDDKELENDQEVERDGTDPYNEVIFGRRRPDSVVIDWANKVICVLNSSVLRINDEITERGWNLEQWLNMTSSSEVLKK